jgi:hypothetical protein
LLAGRLRIATAIAAVGRTARPVQLAKSNAFAAATEISQHSKISGFLIIRVRFFIQESNWN